MPSGNDFDSTSLSLAERLAAQFYNWEQRGRGWLIWDDPVRPEPPFTPFRGYRLPELDASDDGREPTWLSAFVEWACRKLRGECTPKQEVEQPDDFSEGVDDILISDHGIGAELQIALPLDAKVDAESAEGFLLSLGACRTPCAFEIIGLANETLVQLVCGDGDLNHVRSQLQAQFPEASVKDGNRSLAREWGRRGQAKMVVVEFGLSREFMLPFASAQAFSGDLLVNVAGTMEQVEEGELALVQILFEPVRHPWAAGILRAVSTPDGDSIFGGGVVDLLDGAKEKLARPLYAAVVRVACRAGDKGRAWNLARRLGHNLDALANPLGNELIALDNDGYDDDRHASDVPLRQCRRSGMLVNAVELAALVHLPTADVCSGKLKRLGHRTKAAPASVFDHELRLGSNEHAGKVRPVSLSREQRVRHTHVIGASGTGKSTFLLNLILQDIARGEGLALLDPHGDLVDAVLNRIPEHRARDVVLFDPGDEDYPIGFNILAAHSDAEKNLLASDLVGIFRRLSTSWGDQMNAVLANAVLAFLESDRGGTLADLRRFLIEKAFREQFLESVRDPHIVYYWRKEFPLLSGRPHASVLTRLDTFLRPKAIRHIVAQRENRLDFADIMDGGKIFLARLAHGAIGEENVHLLGSLLVAKIHQIAIGRQQMQEERRRHFWLYVDEFQHFATPSMASLLSGVRKYRLGLVLAHQELHQLESRNPDVASAILANAYTRMCFRVGDHDARKLKDGFAAFEAADLQNLSTGEAIARVERADFDFNVQTPNVRPITDAASSARTRGQILENCRTRYAASRQSVEDELRHATDFESSPDLQRSRVKAEREGAPPVRPLAANKADATGAYNANVDVQPDATLARRITPSSRAVENRRPSELPEPTPLGRGGSKHKYVQQLIKQYAQGLGFRATIEENVLGGRGIDVALEKGNTKIACEICITTDDAHEIGNVRKCLAADFQFVAVVCPDDKRLQKLRSAVETSLADNELARVRFFSPDEVLIFIQGVEIEQLERAKSVRGYTVKTAFKPLDAGDQNDRRDAVSRVIAKAVRRVQGRSDKKGN